MADLRDFGRVVDADVAIVGGGLAGLNAAMAAAEEGARVCVIEKAGLARSGSIAGGIDHFTAYLETGEDWDTRETYLQHVAEVSRGSLNLKVHNSLYCRELQPAIERMARIGNPLTQPDGRFYRTRQLSAPGTYSINFNGKHLKPKLAAAAKKLGCQGLERVAATSLIPGEGRVAGIVGFNIRDGRTILVRAKATVLTTGCTERLFESPSGLAFNTWMCPAVTGAAQAMAFRVGAALANMEYMRISVVPRGFCAPGLAGYMGMGCHFVNSLGERFMPRYHPLAEKGPRYKVVEGVLTELREGRGPVFLDCRHLEPAALEHLKKTLSYDKETLPDFFDQKGIDIGKDLLEVMVSEGLQHGPTERCGSGIMIDERCASTVPGLYAAGDSSDQAANGALSVTSGYAAGREAARYALAQDHQPTIDVAEAAAEKERIFLPMARSEGTSPMEMEDVLRRVMWQNVGAVRTEISLKSALAKLQRLEERIDTLTARNYHELMRAHEVHELLLVGKVMASAALYRRETRFGVSHFRADYPETDDANWCGQVVVRKENDEVGLSFLPLTYEMPAK